MPLVIHLLGAVRVERDARAQQAPRGHKAWGLLAYLLLTPTPVARSRLCSLLFADAEDPLAALRWNLSALRRLLGDADLLRGDPVELVLGTGDVVDVQAVVSGSWTDAESVGGLGQELLDGMSFSSSPSFEVWLEAERRHVRAAAEVLLRESALASLATGDGRRACDRAGQLVALNPYDEGFQALLVRSLAAAGDGVAAARQAAACRELFRRELGTEPGAALAAAAATLTAAPVASASAGRAGVVAQLDAGEAAIGAGAVDAGLQCLRRAVADASELADAELRARALLALGNALVHAVRGHDEEGATALHQAVALAEGQSPHLVAEATLELGHVEFLRGRYDRVEVWLTRAEAAASDDAQRARVLIVRGSALSDVGRHATAMTVLRRALELTNDDRRRSYALSMIGRAHLLRAELDDASSALDASIDLATSQRWTSFLPWPESLSASVDLARGDVDTAQDRLEHAFALSCHVGDPCWEGISARGLGLVRAEHGDVEGALRTLRDARARCTRLPDGYLWLDAYTLEAMCALAVHERLDTASEWTAELEALATRTGMRELAIRALAHRAALGDSDSLDIATSLVDTVENRSLRELVSVASQLLTGCDPRDGGGPGTYRGSIRVSEPAAGTGCAAARTPGPAAAAG